MKKRSCPTCFTPTCRKCGGRRCKCEPGKMEIAIYCNCRPANILEFMRRQLDLPPSEKERIHKESKKNMEDWLKKMGHLPLVGWAAMSKEAEKVDKLIKKAESPEEEKPDEEVEVSMVDPDVSVHTFDWGDELAAYLKIRYFKHHDDEESQSDAAMDFFLKLLAEHGTVQITLNRDTDSEYDDSEVIIEVRTPKKEEDEEE